MSGVIATVIDARRRDIGGFAVRRVLPAGLRRTVGPFVFLDHMGPVAMAPGTGMDVPPHPHIGLATVTYLFEGAILHRDSLGSQQVILPGDLNWMTAGRGIVHSERTPTELRAAGMTAHGLQLWVALPIADEETEPAFHHHPGASLPALERDRALLRVLLGCAYGATSPVATRSSLFYVDVTMPAGSALPLPREHEERAAYVVDGAIECEGERATSGRMLVLAPGGDAVLHAESAARVVLLGGAPLDCPRHLVWNFVSSSRARIEQATDDWKAGRFPPVPGDELERVPFPA